MILWWLLALGVPGLAVLAIMFMNHRAARPSGSTDTNEMRFASMHADLCHLFEVVGRHEAVIQALKERMK